ncbi:MAG: phosphoribulokinase [Gemmatimonadota bacterium]
MPFRDQNPILLGIVGDSGSGKSTLSAGIEMILGKERVTDICLDDYHRYDRAGRKAHGITALNPECNHLELMRQHLLLLRAGETIFKPVYDHSDGTFGPPEFVTPRQLVVVHGLLGLYTQPLKSAFHVSVFLDPDPDLRVQWKISRDTAKRGYTPEQVRQQLEHRRHDSETFILPQRGRADLVVRFYPQPGYWQTRDNTRLNVRILQRHDVGGPDLESLLVEAARIACHGKRGRPCLYLEEYSTGGVEEALYIDGSIPDELAAEVEDTLWDQMPRVRHLRPEEIGVFDEGGVIRRSNSLALTQLLVTYYLVRAAEVAREELAASAAAS